MAELIIKRRQRTTQYFTEMLPGDVGLDMILIPGGTFLMGSPKDEPGHYDYEGPQHEVTLQTFFMGRYPVTQSQWRAVAQTLKVNQQLETDPFNFKGHNRPVESVAWDEAMEFCARLSRDTGRQYGLPSEAQWEYACRAGTTTPFHFGEILSTEFANCGGRSYRGIPAGKSRGETTPVGMFPANAWGCCDMHGNVWELCADNWHNSYEHAPNDGSAWLKSNDRESSVLRGGSLNFVPMNCRSAYRYKSRREVRNYNMGFRVMCEAPRTS